MKVKTSITLSSGTIQAIDDIVGPRASRSRVIEQAIIEFVERHHRQRREARDLRILNRSATELNRELEDILLYQSQP